MIINHFAYILMGSSKKTLKIKYGNKTNKIYFYCLYLNGTSFSIVFLLYSNSNFISDDCILFFFEKIDDSEILESSEFLIKTNILLFHNGEIQKL
jgi:hypothetical protein